MRAERDHGRGSLSPRHEFFSSGKEIYIPLDFPLIIRPSYVLGGRGMIIVNDYPTLHKNLKKAFELAPNQPVLVEEFLDGAIEVDIDAKPITIGNITRHIVMVRCIGKYDT